MKIPMKHKQYRYTIVLNRAIPPRKLASYLTGESPTMHAHLKRVIDLQNNRHIYGDTYRVGVPLERQVVPQQPKHLSDKWYNVRRYVTKG